MNLKSIIETSNRVTTFKLIKTDKTGNWLKFQRNVNGQPAGERDFTLAWVKKMISEGSAEINANDELVFKSTGAAEIEW